MCKVLVVWVSTRAVGSVAGKATEADAEIASNGVLTTGKVTTPMILGLTLVQVCGEKKGLENGVSLDGRGRRKQEGGK